jgi:diguanylate cyclase (GGDEF)-like protein
MWLELSEMGRWSGEIWNRAKDGQILIETLTINAVPDASGKTQQYVALFSDITSMKEQKLKLENIAHFDPLTGLPNRVLLADRLHQAMAQSHRLRRPMAIACLDLDNFKDFNDRHGHNTGDQLLTAVTQRMKLALSEGDTLARRGGDEFVVVLPELANVEDSASMLTRLLQAAAEPVHVGDLVLRVSASLGVTFFPQADDVNADQLLRQADHAMYQAKLEGKNRYHIFDPWLDRTVRGHHEDLERIRLALEAREFVLYFQPKVNMCTGEVLGAEALIRWQHPERGLLLPAQFLPVIEGHPLAVEIGEWVIDSALTQMERWHAEGLDIPVSVNIGAQQLQRTGFVARLSDLLGAHPAVAPSSLELEVLESSALQDVAQVAQVIRACGRLGVSFALDDFGTGYSSLTYLRRLPIDVLKIDQTFVRDMLEDPEDLTILEGILGLAAAFRRQIVAEGVETVDHGLMLLRLGCQVAQGYGIARPMPAHDFPAWSAAWLPDPRWHNVLPIDPGDRPLLYAGAEHSAWIDDIESFLEGYRYLPPVLDPGQCRFGAWLQGEDLAGRGWLPALQEVELSHRYLHELANEILAFKARNLKQEALSRIPEIRALRDALFKKLDEIIWGI